MKIILTVLFPIFLLLSPAESVEQEPDWVREMIEKSPDITKIEKCKWGEKEVWKVNSCVVCNDMMIKIYDREQNLLCEYGGVLKINTCSKEKINYTDCEIVHAPNGRELFSF